MKRAIAANGGDRIASIEADVARLRIEVGERQRRADGYADLARIAGLPAAADAESFAANKQAVAAAREKAESDRAVAQNSLSDAKVELRDLRSRHEEVSKELTSLRMRRSNIPARMLDLRESLCNALEVDDSELPFAGELLQVQEEAVAWEGAIERLLHGFGVSLLVPDAQYAEVAAVGRPHAAR